MSKSNEDIDDDSLDDILATIEMPSSGADAVAPSEEKKRRTSSPPDSRLTKLPSSQETANAKAVDKPTTSGSQATVTANSAAGIRTNVSKTNCILVNPKQRGNPILKSITNIPWEFDNSIVPDYIVGATAAILYLSLRYHRLNPDYIHDRLKELGKRFELRILLVQVDVPVMSAS